MKTRTASTSFRSLNVESRSSAGADSARGDAESYRTLPLGALRLGADGRIREYKPLAGQSAMSRRVIGANLFHDLLVLTPLECAAETFRAGIRRGQLFERRRHRFDLPGGPIDVTLLLFYHGRSGEAWAFLGPEGPSGPWMEATSAPERPELRLAV